MQTRNRKLISILLVFALPYLIALILSQQGYLGTLQNKGEWLTDPLTLSEIMERPPLNDTYTWYVLFDQDAAPETEQYLHSGIKTLGSKSNLAAIHKISFPTSLHADKIYLASPQQDIILSYSQSQIMDLVMDLKRLVKPVEKRI